METRNFINGKFIVSISKEKIPIVNPANQKVVGNIDQALDNEINLAFESAKKAFDKRILLDMDPKEPEQLEESEPTEISESENEVEEDPVQQPSPPTTEEEIQSESESEAEVIE